MLKDGKNIYYSNAINEDFFEKRNLNKIKIDGKYNYLPQNIFFKIFSFLLYYVIAIPILFLITSIGMKVKIKGKQNIKKLKTGYILYSNHTHKYDCIVAPVRLTSPKRTYILSTKDAVEIPIAKMFTKALGCMPIADTLDGLKNLNKSISTVLKQNKALVIYPEAHVWQYYTDVREFPSTSFKYAIYNNVPVVPVAVTYRQRKIFKKRTPLMCVEIGKPIYINNDLNNEDNLKMLRDGVYYFIKEKVSTKNNYAYYNYIKIDNKKTK